MKSKAFSLLAAALFALVAIPSVAQITVPTPDLGVKSNVPGTTYDSTNPYIYYAEEFNNGVRGRLITGSYSINALDFWTAGTERISDLGDGLFRGIYSAGAVGSIPSGYSGIFSGFAYYPGKQALYSGTWTSASGSGAGLIDANVGQYSLNLGQDTTASGTGSVAIGISSTASGANSVSIGNLNTSSGNTSFALGHSNTATGADAFSLGRNSDATATRAISIGRDVDTAGQDDLALGAYISTAGGATLPTVEYVFGSGVDSSNRLDVANGQMGFGIYSTVPTLSITASAGAGTVGLIGAGLGATVPTAFVDVAASTTSAASLRLRHGTAPTAPNDGDLWSTTAGFYGRVNGATVGPFSDGSAIDFGAITTGTNTSATMTVDTGASIAPANSGTITATDGDSATSFFSTGTLEDARLSSNVPLLNASNTWSGTYNDYGTTGVIRFGSGVGSRAGIMYKSGYTLAVTYDTSGLSSYAILEAYGLGVANPSGGVSPMYLTPTASGVVSFADGGSNPTALLSKVLVEANTAGVGSPNVLTAIESGTVITNEGATAETYNTLPSAAAGLRFEAIVQSGSWHLRFTANTGDTIRIGGTVSAAAGYVRSTTAGDTAICTAINATEWVCSVTGTWTVDS